MQLRQRWPFLAHLTVWLSPIETPAEAMAACGGFIGVTGHGDLYYVAEYIEAMENDPLMAVLAHEVLHPGLGSMFRCGTRDKQLWNVATDLIINDILVDEGLGDALRETYRNKFAEQMFEKMGGSATGERVELIPNGHQISVFGITISNINTKTAEEVYDELMQSRAGKAAQRGKKTVVVTISAGFGGEGDGEAMGNSGEGEGEGKDGKGQKSDGSGNSGGKTPQQLENEWRKRLVNAATAAQLSGSGRGTVPGRISEMIDKMLNPQVPWWIYIEQYVERSLISDFSYRRPRKTYYDTGVYLPSVVRESIDLVVHFDTSGSMTSDQLAVAMSECYYLLNAHPNVHIWLLICDADIHNVVELTTQSSFDVKKVKMDGRGGTSHEPVVDWILKEKPDAPVLISFTDGYSDIQHCYPKLPHGCRRLLVLTGADANTGKQLAEYADVLHINSEE